MSIVQQNSNENQIKEVGRDLSLDKSLKQVIEQGQSNQGRPIKRSWLNRFLFKSLSYVKQYIWDDDYCENQNGISHMKIETNQFTKSKSDPFLQTSAQNFNSCNPSLNDITLNQMSSLNTKAQNDLKLESGGFMLPNPKKESDDPNLSSDFMVVGDIICGVADGVGNWEQWSINPRNFAEQILSNTCNFASQYLKSYQNNSMDQDILNQLSEESLSKSLRVCTSPGSSTIIFYFVRNNILHCSYIGDSQLVILRKDIVGKYKMVLGTKPTQISFNTPLQIMRWPTPQQINQIEMQNPSAAKYLKQKKIEIMKNASLPSQLTNISFMVQQGDLLICASDGFFDNFSVDFLEMFINQKLASNENISAQVLSKKLCKLAWMCSQDKTFLSPFSKKCLEQNKKFMGGKQDDVTVVVSRII